MTPPMTDRARELAQQMPRIIANAVFDLRTRQMIEITKLIETAFAEVRREEQNITLDKVREKVEELTKDSVVGVSEYNEALNDVDDVIDELRALSPDPAPRDDPARALAKLLIAAKRARDVLINEFVEPGRTAFWTLVDAINKAEVKS